MAFVTRSVINPDDGKWKWAMNEQVFDTVCEFKKEFLSTQIWDDGARENIGAVFGILHGAFYIGILHWHFTWRDMSKSSPNVLKI